MEDNRERLDLEKEFMGDFFKVFLNEQGADTSALRQAAGGAVDIQRLARMGEAIGEPSSSEPSIDPDSDSLSESQPEQEDGETLTALGAKPRKDQLPVIYRKMENNSYGVPMPETVYRFTHLYMPNNAKKLKKMIDFNHKVIENAMAPEPEDNEEQRENKRQMKTEWKKWLRLLKHHSSFANPSGSHGSIEPYLYQKLEKQKENHSRQTKRPLLKPAQTRHFQPTQRNESLQSLPQIAQVNGLPPLRSFAPSLIQNKSQANTQVQYPKSISQKSQMKACQLTEIEPKLFDQDKTLVQDTAISNQGKNKPIQPRKQIVQNNLAHKYPTYNFTTIEKECYTFMHKLGRVDASLAPGKKSVKLDSVNVPSDHKLQEWVIEQNYKSCIPASQPKNVVQAQPILRKRYWGELKDCSSAQQLSRDEHEWRKHRPARAKQIFKLHRDDNLAIKMQPIDTYQEYCAVKEREAKLYLHGSGAKAAGDVAAKVTAKSIMRHVKWKLGDIDDQTFYAQEYAEYEELKMQSYHSQKNGMRRNNPQRAPSSILNTRELSGMRGSALGEAKDQARSSQKVFAVSENFDNHYEDKKKDLQRDMLNKIQKKERANAQPSKAATTIAYEPVPGSVPGQPPIPQYKQNTLMPPGMQDGDKRSPGKKAAYRPGDSSDEDSSSDSSSDSDGDQGPQFGRIGKVLPHLGEELNHASCIKDLSFCKLNWTAEDLNRFHRPDITQLFCASPKDAKMTVTPRATTDKQTSRNKLTPGDHFSDRFKLSLREAGRFCVFEHIDQNPLFVNNFGMASRLKKYYYGENEPKSKEFRDKAQNKMTRHMGPYEHGTIVMKKKGEKLDLLGQIAHEDFKGITMLENNMYNAPVFYHSADRQDFFCSVHLNKKTLAREVIVRELDNLYTVGQIEPKKEVLNPQSRNYQNFIKKQCTAYIIRDLSEKQKQRDNMFNSAEVKVNFADIRLKFPDINEAILKKGLKDYDIEVNRDGYCRFQKNFEPEKFKERMTPENICQYESARFGQNRLRKLGITRILDANKISYSTNKFCEEETNIKLQRIAKLIECEVLCTPWNLSAWYIKIKQEGSMMMLEKQGDPSFGKGGFSFLKMPLKISSDSLWGARQNRMNLNPAIQNPRAVTGTDADLRKLKKKVIKQKLLDMGYTEQQLFNLTRWQMIGHLRCNAPQYEQNQIYIRGVRYDSRKQQQVYNETANEIFSKQMKNLSDYCPQYCQNDYSEPEPDFVADDPEQDRQKTVLKPNIVNNALKVGKNATIFTQDLQELSQDLDSKKFQVESFDFKEIKHVHDIDEYFKLLLSNLTASQINTGQSMLSLQQDADAQRFDERFKKDPKSLFEEKWRAGEIRFDKNPILRKKIRSLVDSRTPVLDENGEEIQQYQRIIYTADEKTIKKFNRCRDKMKTKDVKLGTANRKMPSFNPNRRRPGGRSPFENADSTSVVSGGQGDGDSSHGNQKKSNFKLLTQPNLQQHDRLQKTSPQKAGASSSTLKNKGGPTISLASRGQGSIKHPNVPEFNQVQQNKEIRFIAKPGVVKTQEATKSKAISLTFSNNPEAAVAYSESSHQSEGNDGSSQAYREESNQSSADLLSTKAIAREATRALKLAQKREKSQMQKTQRQQAAQAKKQSVSMSFGGAKSRGRNTQSATTLQKFQSTGSIQEDFQYESPAVQKSNRTRQKQCDSELNSIFEKILEEITKADPNLIFDTVPTKAQYPDYRDRVQRPIALHDMRLKTKRCEYKSELGFIEDIQTMKENASTYNGPQHWVTNIAVNLELAAREAVKKKKGEILNLEHLIKEKHR